MNKPLRLALIGWGAIGQTVGQMLTESQVGRPNIEIIAVGVRDASVDREAIPKGAVLIDSPDDLAELAPDVVAEAAGRDSVAPWGRAALNVGADYIVSSVSAFADQALLAELIDLAASNGCHVHIQPGALGGVDALASSRLMGITTVEHRIVKPPRAWGDTPAEELCDLAALTAPTEFFSGDAIETANAFPKNANVAMTTALAGIGPKATKIILVADPTAQTNRHEITASGAFGDLHVSIANNPLPANPKTSAMAALNLVRGIENRVTSIVI